MTDEGRVLRQIADTLEETTKVLTEMRKINMEMRKSLLRSESTVALIRTDMQKLLREMQLARKTIESDDVG